MMSHFQTDLIGSQPGYASGWQPWSGRGGTVLAVLLQQGDPSRRGLRVVLDGHHIRTCGKLLTSTSRLLSEAVWTERAYRVLPGPAPAPAWSAQGPAEPFRKHRSVAGFGERTSMEVHPHPAPSTKSTVSHAVLSSGARSANPFGAGPPGASPMGAAVGLTPLATNTSPNGRSGVSPGANTNRRYRPGWSYGCKA